VPFWKLTLDDSELLRRLSDGSFHSLGGIFGLDVQSHTISEGVTPVPFGGEHDYLRMLREAQRESNRSSTKVSPITSAIMSLSTTPRRTSPISSPNPKSPPNSPNSELATFTEELRGVYVNSLTTDHVGIHGYAGNGTNGGNGSNSASSVSNSSNHGVTPSDIVWDWTSRPNIPPKEWKLPSLRRRKSSESSKVSFQNGKAKKKSPFSKEVVYTLVITNLLSFLIGTGIGIWLSKRAIDQSGCYGEMIEISI
jgi:BCL2/adenovirus E1B protein-interacting protein 3